MGLLIVVASLNPGSNMLHVQQLLDSSHGWWRISPSSWVVCSPDATAQFWTERLTPLVRPHGSLFICELNAEQRFGWMGTSFWHWFEEHRHL